MATSTLIQFISAGEAASVSNRRQIETFLAGGTIAAGDWVAFDLSQTGADKVLYAVQSPASAGSPIGIGVALAAAAAGDKVDVVVDGYAGTANVASGTAAGSAIMLSGTAGRAAAATYVADGSGGAADALPAICGVALTLAAANVAEVWVYKQF